MEFDERHIEQSADTLEQEAETLSVQSAEQEAREARLEQALTELERDADVSRTLADSGRILTEERQILEARREEAFASLEELRVQAEQLSAENETSRTSLDMLREMGEDVKEGDLIIENRQRWLEECHVRIERLAGLLGESFESLGDFSVVRASKTEAGTETEQEREQQEPDCAADRVKEEACSDADENSNTTFKPLHPMPEHETAAPFRPISATVTEPVTDTNFLYGEGGGWQIFVSDAERMMQTGRLSCVRSRTLTLSDDEIERMRSVHWTDETQAQIREDRRHQQSDQEDSRGMYHPDGVRPPRELQNGEILFQIRPTTAERVSPYFTNEATVRSCLDEHGRLDANVLLHKLQVAPACDETGTLCSTYTLKAYRYWDGVYTGEAAASIKKGADNDDTEERVRERVPWER